MKKNWFTLLEVMLSIILLSLMIWAILGAYTSVQRANLKMTNTQKAVQVAEDFLERVNDLSVDYEIDTGKYTLGNGHWQIIDTGTLHLKHKTNNIQISFYGVSSWLVTGLYMEQSYMEQNGTVVNLVNSEVVKVDNLNFEIYPNDQYVNINVTTSVIWWEVLFKSWVTLSNTVWFKYYNQYWPTDTLFINEISWNDPVSVSRWIY